MKFYVATQKQENARPVRDALSKFGYVCTASWIDLEGYVSIPGEFDARREAALTCQREIADSDILILVAEPTGERVRGGKHVETGMAIALGKPVYVIGIRENVFHWHPSVRLFSTLAEFLDFLTGAA